MLESVILRETSAFHEQANHLTYLLVMAMAGVSHAGACASWLLLDQGPHQQLFHPSSQSQAELGGGKREADRCNLDAQMGIEESWVLPSTLGP